VHDEVHSNATVERSLPAATEPSMPSGLVGRVTQALGDRAGDHAAVPVRLKMIDFKGAELARTQAGPYGSCRLPGPPDAALLVFSSPGHQPYARMVTRTDAEHRHDVVLAATRSAVARPAVC